MNGSQTFVSRVLIGLAIAAHPRVRPVSPPL